MNKWVLFFYGLLQICCALASAENHDLEKINFKIASFEEYLFSAKVDFLLSKMEKLSLDTLQEDHVDEAFLKTGSFLVGRYVYLSRAQQSRLLKCITI
ncbi:hypothetical protein FJ366_02860 [Candidatus Dependentiae bacterium]|nr:hypothetical protein [Candidatus Dependentiae bacterium]